MKEQKQTQTYKSLEGICRYNKQLVYKRRNSAMSVKPWKSLQSGVPLIMSLNVQSYISKCRTILTKLISKDFSVSLKLYFKIF